MSYTLADVDEAVRRIEDEFPDARFQRTDYGWGLMVTVGIHGMIVFQPARPKTGRGEIARSARHVIAWLRDKTIRRTDAPPLVPPAPA